MKVELTAEQRQKIGRLANTIFPGSEQQPSAAALELQSSPLDRVFASRPDLVEPLLRLIDGFEGDSSRFLGNLADSDYALVMTVIAAAYVMDHRVMRALGYDGQQALTPSRGGFGCETLVLDMMQGAKTYRQ